VVNLTDLGVVAHSFAVYKDVDVAAHAAALVEDPTAESGVCVLEHAQQLGYRGALDIVLRAVARTLLEGPTKSHHRHSGHTRSNRATDEFWPVSRSTPRTQEKKGVDAMTEQPTGTQDRKRWIALYVLCIGMLMIVLDATVVNVALPSIQDDLGFSQSSLAWVVNAYLIAFGGLLLLAGRFGDLIGRKSIFLVGLGVFTVASLLCGVAQSQELLVAARFVQGVGGALTSAVILGMIVTMFPEPREQAKAIGVYAFVASAGGSVGLLAGGVLTQSINWHWIFFVNVPIGIATAVLALRLLEKDTGIGFRAGADIPGAVLITSSLMLGVYTIVKPAADYGWGAGRTLALGAASVVLLVAFLVREARARTPLIPLRIFRSRNVAGANAIQALSVAGMFGMFFLGALYLQRVLGYDALELGLAFLPVSIVMGTLSIRYSERLVMRFGAKNTLIPGLLLIAAGLALFTLAPVGGSYVQHVLPVMILLGVGAGASFPALMTLAMSGATQEDAGLASGLVNTSAQVGGALGLAVLATLSATRTHDAAAAGSGTASSLTSGYHLAFLIGAGLVLAAAAVAVAVLEAPQQADAQVEAAPEPEAEDEDEAYCEAA
jgi:EmrB/QacA subfamily drug resistance transporter